MILYTMTRICTEKAFKNPCFFVPVRRRIRVQKVITAIPIELK